MFPKLVNEAIIKFTMSAEGPLLINEPAGSKIDPTLPDMSFVRCSHYGAKTVYIPGSSIKGVFRSRYEQLLAMYKKQHAGHTPISVCNIFKNNEHNPQNAAQSVNQSNPSKSKKEDVEELANCSSRLKAKLRKSFLNGEQRYQESCHACKLFGNLVLGSRVSFIDAYPLQDSDLVLGIRHGVGIDRITGAAADKALYDIEVVESGTFQFEICMQNFELYQLYLLLFIIQDINEGRVTFGMGGSRGNGHMRLNNTQDVQIQYRLYDQKKDDKKLRGYREGDIGGEVVYTVQSLYKECRFDRLDYICAALEQAANRFFR